MRFGSVCSGIEAASVAWHPLGWEAAWYAEIESFPCEVLKHHYPTVPNLGDITTEDFCERARARGPIDVLIGGTPCQSFSVAGLRKGLADPRGNLALVFLRIVDALRPRWVVWENVPGVLSSSEGRDFGAFLGGMGQLGYGWSYRILDAQYFGVPQRRRRVFVVGHLGGWQGAAAVLLESNCLQGHPAPRREKREILAPTVTGGPPFSRTGNEGVEHDAYIPSCAFSLNAHGQRLDSESETLLPIVIRTAQTSANGHGIAENITHTLDRTQGQAVIAFNHQSPNLSVGSLSHTLRVGQTEAVAGFLPSAGNSYGIGYAEELAPTLRSGCHDYGLHQQMQVRRLTPLECERLQGFPDNYTLISPKSKDGPRYKALGNSMATPVVQWIGKRIKMVDTLLQEHTQ